MKATLSGRPYVAWWSHHPQRGSKSISFYNSLCSRINLRDTSTETHCVCDSNKNFDDAPETRSTALGPYRAACLDLQTLKSGYNLCHTQGVTQQ